METTPPAARPAEPGLPTVGFDTGFFVRLLQADARAAGVWADVRAGRVAGAVSCLTLFELDRLGLRGQIARGPTEALVDALPATCRVVWLGAGDGPDGGAARLAHGNGLAMADAVILASLLDAGAAAVYTTYPDLERYEGPVDIVVL